LREQDLTAKKTTVGGAGTKRKARDVEETSFFSYFESDNADLNQSMAQILFEDFWRRAFDYHQGVRATALPSFAPLPGPAPHSPSATADAVLLPCRDG